MARPEFTAMTDPSLRLRIQPFQRLRLVTSNGGAHQRRPQDDIAMCPDPTAAAVKCSRLFGGLSELGAAATTGMPQRNDLNGARRINEPVVQVIIDAAQ